MTSIWSYERSARTLPPVIICSKMKAHYEKGNPNMTNTDLTFITNEKKQSLKERFEVLKREVILSLYLSGE